MQLFYVVNGWAGRVAWLDEATRLFYVGALPLLWCALAWLLIAAPRSWAAFSRRRIGASTGVALLGAFLLWQGLEWAAREIWSTPIFSPRPFVTHWVNLLVVEPNDNSYPCIEVLLASVGATLCWAASLRAGALAWGWTILYGIARVFCGSNYPIDVGAGWLLGWALSAFALALWRAPLRIPAQGGARLRWRRRHQAVLSMACVALFLGSALIEMLGAPQALRRSGPIFGAHVAAAPVEPTDAHTDASGTSGNSSSASAAGSAAGLASAPSALPLDGAYGRQPKVEATVRRALESLKLAHRIVDVEVAQTTVGNSIFRVASASFEVQPTRADERREVTRSSARIARACFAADPQTQNVDVLGVIFQARHTGESFGEGGGASAPEVVKPLPIFTASIQRSNLLLRGKAAWANSRGVDEGLWLRARSRLFIDSQMLPRAPEATPTPTPTAKPVPTPVAKPVPKAKTIAPAKPAMAKPAVPQVPPKAASGPVSKVPTKPTTAPKSPVKAMPKAAVKAQPRRTQPQRPKYLRRRARPYRGYRSRRWRG